MINHALMVFNGHDTEGARRYAKQHNIFFIELEDAMNWERQNGKDFSESMYANYLRHILPTLEKEVVIIANIFFSGEMQAIKENVNELDDFIWVCREPT